MFIKSYVINSCMKICPKCGASSDRKKFIGQFCIDCYPVRIKLNINRLVYTLCRECNKIKIGNKWMNYSDDIFERYIRKNTTGDYDDLKFDISTGKITYYLTREGQSFKITKKIDVVENQGLCNVCSRKHGGYYEAIVQLRCVKKEDIEKVLHLADKVKIKLKKLTFISKEIEHRTGIDLYVGDKRSVEEVLNSLKLGYKKTYKLYGVKQGRRIYRTTYLVRV